MVMTYCIHVSVQGETLFGVGKLVSFVKNLEYSRTLDPIEVGETSFFMINCLSFYDISFLIMFFWIL